VARKLSENEGKILFYVVQAIYFGAGESSSQQEMSDALGIATASVSNAVSKLRRERYVAGKGRSILLTRDAEEKLLRDGDLIRAIFFLRDSCAQGKESLLPDLEDIDAQLAEFFGIESGRATWMSGELKRKGYLATTGAGRLRINSQRVGEEIHYLRLWT
jgi:hypothetical protein